MISKGYSKEEILELDYTEEEYKEAEKNCLQQFNVCEIVDVINREFRLRERKC